MIVFPGQSLTMTPSKQPMQPDTGSARHRPAPDALLWGLSPVELHDAYWRAHGVQCVRRYRREPPQRDADLFLLVEPDQLVLFDLFELADHIAWRKAAVTRVRVVDVTDQPYREQVDIDADGRARSVTRYYHPRSRAAYRVMLTSKRRLMQIWMDAGTRRDAWKKIRATAGRRHIDNLRCEGACFAAGRRAEEAAMVGRLVAKWPRPDAAIEGIQELREGIWGSAATTLGEDRICVGPMWLGVQASRSADTCLIGPAWLPDTDHDPVSGARGVRVRDIREIEPDPTRTSRQRADHRRPGYCLAKRAFDLLMSSVGLLASLPVFCVVPILIILNDGFPVFYGHVRQTLGGRSFRCWKFRTMARNADVMKFALSKQNTCDGRQFFIRDDPRVTRIGRFLRRYHLDELPQLWNVLRGQMSLVGPRPSPDDENQLCPAWRELRLSVRPGITGLWQVKCTRQAGVDFQEWIQFDTEYVRCASFWLDLVILGRTIRKLFMRGHTHVSHETR